MLTDQTITVEVYMHKKFKVNSHHFDMNYKFKNYKKFLKTYLKL